MSTLEWIIVCAIGIIVLAVIVCVVTVKQIRQFMNQVREDERRAAEEEDERQAAGEDEKNKDELGAKL